MVITISRQYGAGGSEVARRVAEVLAWQVVDNELVEHVAVRAGCTPAEIAEREERAPNFIERLTRTLAAANPDRLDGIFGDAPWTNKARLPDHTLKNLIEHFSKLTFGNKNVNSDLLGDAYEYLIKKFADATNKKAGEFYTPRSVVRLMIDILDPKEAETIYDPACGTGGMLLAAVQHVNEQHGDVKRAEGCADERSPTPGFRSWKRPSAARAQRPSAPIA